MTVNYKDTTIFYTSNGSGNPLVLLHGFLETSNIWKPFLFELSLKRQVICIDLPGHGKSGNIDEIHSMQLMSNVVKAVLEDLAVETATLVGHSMGGYVCLAFLKQFPVSISGIVLMNSTPEEDSEERKENRDRAIAMVKKNKEAYVSMAISNLLAPENKPKFLSQIEELKNEALNFSVEGITAALKGMKIRTSSISALTLFNNQKIIITGQNDPVLNTERLQNLANKCSCTLFLAENGHLSYLENSAKIREILHFID